MLRSGALCVLCETIDVKPQPEIRPFPGLNTMDQGSAEPTTQTPAMSLARLADQVSKANQHMMSLDSLGNIYWGLSHLLELGLAGDVVELGCHAGYTSIYLQTIIAHTDPDRRLHVYDSFEGLPKPGPRDGTYFSAGELRVGPQDLTATFDAWGLRHPVVHAGWFEDTLPAGLPDKIAFGLLDADFYESTLVGLRHVWPRVVPGGIVMIDDYCDPHENPWAWPEMPGVKAACDEFFANTRERLVTLVGCGSMACAYVRKNIGSNHAMILQTGGR